MNRGDVDARAAPVSDERPARFCDNVRPAPVFDRKPRRVATIAQHCCLWPKMAAMQLHARFDLKKRKAWIDAKDNCLVMRCTASKRAMHRKLRGVEQEKASGP